jgi:hypothetical protein
LQGSRECGDKGDKGTPKNKLSQIQNLPVGAQGIAPLRWDDFLIGNLQGKQRKQRV